MTMTREELIEQCRYYHGGELDESLRNNSLSWFWEMERVYVNSGGTFEGEKDYYEALGGRKYKGIPDNLLYVMFTAWAKYTFFVKENLPAFYKLVDEYLEMQSDHFPVDEIPSNENFRYDMD